jgi:hypothetical protein
MPRERTVVVPFRRPRCKVPHCERDSECRGLCRSCYQSAYLLVSAGVTSWDELEKRGKVQPTTTAKSWFLSEA